MSWRSLTRYHPIVGYTFMPGLKARVDNSEGGYLVSTNQAGFRCRHEAVPEKSSPHRILLFGDSYTAGDCVSNPYRYGDQLEELIPGLEVLNFGLPGTGTDQQYLAWQEFAKPLQHDLLVVGVFVENILRCWSRFREYRDQRNQVQVYAKPYFQLTDGGELLLQGTPVKKQPLQQSELGPEAAEFLYSGAPLPTLYKVFRRIGLPDIGQKLTKFDLVPEYEDPNNPRWQLMRAILKAWIRDSVKPVLLVVIPYFAYVEESADPQFYQARFAELAQETGCFLHDPLKDFQSYPMQQRRDFRFKTDPHLTRAGNRALAESVAPVIRQILTRDEVSK